MSALLDALGIRATTWRRVVAVAIWVGFAGAMLAIAAVQAVVERWLGPSAGLSAALLVAVWVGWTVWHSHLFDSHRRTYLRSGVRHPYRRAFLVDIFPGISIGFSQMLRSAWNGSTLDTGLFPQLAQDAPGRLLQALGIVVFLASFSLFASAWRTLGAARVGFVAEFTDVARFAPMRRGPYARVRHPLFWSGIGVSWALALLTFGTTGYIVAALNSAYGLVYNVLEDRRLLLVFGDGYRDYQREVPHIVPLRRPVAAFADARPGSDAVSGVSPAGR